ncbi:hypothetical protein BH20GEM2_BH20GEM2_03460 [soil metagenome]
MIVPAADETQLKDALKAALVEVLEERGDLLRDVLAEVLEDLALVQAIQEGEPSEEVSRNEIFDILGSSE